MSKLTLLRRHLAALRRRRAAARWGAALATLLLAWLLIVAAVFVVDVVFELDVAQRVVMLVIGGLLGLVASTRALRPAWGARENEIDMALLVERRQGIDSDLTAALQFDRPAASDWGSPRLATAVIDDVCRRERDLDVSAGESWRPAAQRVALLLLAAGLAGMAAWGFPEYVRVFGRRLLLASPHYPTRTTIQAIAINQRQVLDHQAQRTTPVDRSLPRGSAVEVIVRASGELPTAGQLRLTAAGGGGTRVVDLAKLSRAEVGELVARNGGNDPTREPTDPPEKTDWDPTAEYYRADAGRLLEPLVYQVYLGDAWTDPARLAPIAPPLVDLELQVTPPEYARAATSSLRPASRHFAVLEGSVVDFTVVSANDKTLRDVWVDVRQGATTERYELQKGDEQGRSWSLDVAGTPLADVRDEFHFEVQAIDTDDLSLETPLRGFVRIQADQPPIATIDVVHRVVLPTARPVVAYRLQDDFGIGRLILHVGVERKQNGPPPEMPDAANAARRPNEDDPTGSSGLGSSGLGSSGLGSSGLGSSGLGSSGLGSSASDDPTAGGPATAAEQHAFEVSLPGGLLRADQLPTDGSYPLELAPLNLEKGDRLKLTLEAVDQRGDAPGASFLTEPVTLEVTDEAGVLAAIAEADEQSEQRLDQVIQQQLGIGDGS